MAATQSPNPVSQTANIDIPQNAHPGTPVQKEWPSLSYASSSDGSTSPTAKQDGGMPTPATPSVAKPIKLRQANNPAPTNTEAGLPEGEDVIDCEGDDEYARGTGTLFDDTLGDPYSRPLNERRKGANLRLMQSKAYSQLLEERVMVLESTVQRIQNLPPLPTTQDDSYTPEVPVTCPRVDILSWAEFRAPSKVDKKPGVGWTHSPELESGTLGDTKKMKSTIEILREEPRFTLEVISDPRFPTEVEQIPTTSDLTRIPEPQPHLPTEVEPHRIRIRSKLLLKVLDEITGCNTTAGPYGHRLVLLRPFKLLITFEKHLRDYLADLDKMHSISTDENGLFLFQVHVSTYRARCTHMAAI